MIYETKEQNDLLYVCSLIEFVGRATKNKNADIVRAIGKEGLAWNLEFADVNHCLSFEEVGDETIERHAIENGNFDLISICKYNVPDYIDIGGVYRDLILDVQAEHGGEIVDIIFDVFTSFISEEISDFNSSLFYENPSYIYHSYLAGELLD